MQPQYSLNRNRSPNLKDNGLNRVKPPLTKKEARIGFKLNHNKKGVVPLFIIATTLILIVIGLATLFLKPAYGVSESTAKAEVDKHAIGGDVKTQPSEIRDNDQTTTSPDSTPTNTQPSPITQECKVTGEWQELWVKEKMGIDYATGSTRTKSLGIFKYTGTCTQDIYLEAGIIPQTKVPLTISPYIVGAMPTTPSWCDANQNYYGHLWKDVKQGQLLRVDFKPRTPQEEGGYKVVVGAYTGCLSDKTTSTPIKASGQEIISNTYTIRISDRLYENSIGVEDIESSQSWVRKI